MFSELQKLLDTETNKSYNEMPINFVDWYDVNNLDGMLRLETFSDNEHQIHWFTENELFQAKVSEELTNFRINLPSGYIIIDKPK